MSITDRLRTENMRAAMTASPSSISSGDSGRSSYESSDAQRMNAALDELRGYCRTEVTLKSFEAFEAQLRKSTNMHRRPVQQRMSRGGTELSDEDADRTLRARLNTQHALQSRATAATTRGISRISTPIKVEPPLPSIFSRLALTKSKTTSNLATLSNLSTFGIPNSSTSKLSIPCISHSLGAKMTEPIQHIRRKSDLQTAQKVGVEALEGREERAKRKATDAQRRVSNRTMSIGSTQSSMSSGFIQANVSKLVKRSHVRQSSTTTSLPHLRQEQSFAKVDGDDDAADDVSVDAIEAGHRHAQPPKPKSRGRAEVELVEAHKGMRSHWDAETKTVGAEKVIRSKSRRQTERLSSGEVVKTIFDAGISQVKKMGRRVGGSMSWAGSAEDLNAMVSGREGEY